MYKFKARRLKDDYPEIVKWLKVIPKKAEKTLLVHSFRNNQSKYLESKGVEKVLHKLQNNFK